MKKLTFSIYLFPLVGLAACSSTQIGSHSKVVEPTQEQLSLLKSMGYECKTEKPIHSRIPKKTCTTSLQREQNEIRAKKMIQEYKAGGSGESDK